jgi:ATP-dependent Clp protease adapter protein ClpS
MDSASEPVKLPKPEMEKEARWADDPAPAYDVICWDDPVNYIEVETYVFRGDSISFTRPAIVDMISAAIIP